MLPTATDLLRGTQSRAACSAAAGTHSACAGALTSEWRAPHDAASLSDGTEVTAERQDNQRLYDLAETMSADELRW